MSLLVATTLTPTSASAGATAGGPSLQIPPDVRAEGMGGVWAPLSITAFSAWGNVGGLGLLEGVQFAKMDAQLVPGLADDVFFDYYSIVVGYSPISELVPLNISIGYNRTDLVGTPVATENTDGFTLAIGVAGLVGVGVGIKHFEVNFAPEEFASGGSGQGDVTAVDYGILARSPYLIFDSNAETSISFQRSSSGQISLRILGGLAWSNRGDDIVLTEGLEGDPQPRLRRESIGFELNAFPLSKRLDFNSSFLNRVFRDTHVLTLSAGIGRRDGLIDEAIPDSIAANLSKNDREDIVTFDGFEIRLFDVFSYRRGTIFDDPGEIKGSTNGWGISFLGYAGVDYAEIPQFRSLPRVEKWSFWVRVPLDW